MDNLPQILEAVMIAVFGISWPFNVAKSFRARTAKGKSLGFIIVIEIGYAIGIINKLFVDKNYMASFSHNWYVLFFYVLNFMMIMMDMILYFRNRKFDKATEEAKKHDGHV